MRVKHVVVDALSRKSVHTLCMAMSQVKLRDEVEKIGISMIRKGDVVSDLTIEPELYAEIRDKQGVDSRLASWHASVEKGEPSRFQIHVDGSLRFKGRWCVPDDEELKRNILTQAYNTPYFVHREEIGYVKTLRKPSGSRDIWSKAELAKAYCMNVVKLHGVPKDIISDRDSRFIS
ncbi:uncharacterized protein LOC141588134 [Silene latifolia]|uniref:uncharacterized protein LOC141588134 n=1 Tax=Silene latifolia TaxID=37657 RepID=UPI003D77F169